MTTLTVVDGHNLFNDAARELARARLRPDLLARYFREWFDVDRLISATVAGRRELPSDPPGNFGTVIFHSRNALGGDKAMYRIADTTPFWQRQGAAPNTSTFFFEVPGAPRGKGRPKDEKDDAKTDEAAEQEPENDVGLVTTGRDYGMDVAIAVYLMETAPRWEAAVLFTGDTDLVAAVWSLKRQGKRIFCSLPPRGAASPLVLACQSFFPWDITFLRADFAMFAFLSAGGVLDRFVVHDLVKVAQIGLVGGGLTLKPIRSGGAENVLNEMLRTEGLALYAGGSGDWIHVAHALEPGTAPGAGQTPSLGDPLARHLDLFSDAAWYQRLG
jgi:hypothetical protein